MNPNGFWPFKQQETSKNNIQNEPKMKQNNDVGNKQIKHILIIIQLIIAKTKKCFSESKVNETHLFCKTQTR